MSRHRHNYRPWQPEAAATCASGKRDVTRNEHVKCDQACLVVHTVLNLVLLHADPTDATRLLIDCPMTA